MDDVGGGSLDTLGAIRQLPDGEVAALLRVADVDGDAAAAIRAGIASGRLSGARLRELVGRHALRGQDLSLFVLREVLERSHADACRVAGVDERTGRKRLAAVRAKLGRPADASAAGVGQWLVTELIAPPTRVLQLQLFTMEGGADGQGSEEAQDDRQARLALEESEPRPQAGNGPR
ncbi:MAG: hypothetical protein KGN00_04160 [Chloroflexota bacterium]|nr:hypothetical protein [Chloroflexota bacterium]MDE3192864.1 hypothetical protein [Chloroflexota bacterium]